MSLVIAVYALTEHFPKSELYGLSSQMRRCAVSIPSNIAEGRRRGHKAEFRQFLYIAYGSGAELETQLEITQRLNFGKELDRETATNLLIKIMKMLNAMLENLRS